MSIQSEVDVLRILFDLAAPATYICPPKRRNFSVRVVLPASGCDMMANVRLRSISLFTVLKRPTPALPVREGV